MDFNQIKDQVSNLSLYDLKAGVRKVQNGTWQEIRYQFPACFMDGELLSISMLIGVERFLLSNH